MPPSALAKSPLVPSGVRARSRLKETLSLPEIRDQQHKHFWLAVILPLAVSLLAIPLLIHAGLGWKDWSIFGVMWAITTVGIEMGYHRYFSHAAFEAIRPFRNFLLIAGSMGGQGPALSWATNHRHHHRYSDKPGDPHSPNDGFIHAQLTWMHEYDYANPRLYTPELIRDRQLMQLDRKYYLWLVSGIILPAIFGGLIGGFSGAWKGLLFGGVIRLSFIQFSTGLINSLCHALGKQHFRSHDDSRNVAWLAPFTLGGSLHNNHHAFPRSANNQHERGQFDPCWWLLRGLEKLGVVSNLRVPSPETLEVKRLR